MSNLRSKRRNKFNKARNNLTFIISIISSRYGVKRLSNVGFGESSIQSECCVAETVRISRFNWCRNWSKSITCHATFSLFGHQDIPKLKSSLIYYVTYVLLLIQQLNLIKYIYIFIRNLICRILQWAGLQDGLAKLFFKVSLAWFTLLQSWIYLLEKWKFHVQNIRVIKIFFIDD